MEVTIKKLNFSKQLFLILMGMIFPLAAFAQQAAITGTVTDAGGEPVIGANVMIKGTSAGAITDFNGNYSLTGVNTAQDVLVFSFIGYVTQEVPVSGRTVVNAVLQEDSQLLSEVVVIGYGQVRKGDATGALTSVKADPSTRGLAPNAQDMLVGKIAGVNITNSGGSPTAASTIRIRGGSSLSASNDPLVIIDGVPIDNGGIGGVGNLLSTINPTDIETYTVLKDASATAIYGSRASNGVILITTRKGAEGKVNVNYDGNIAISTRTKEVDVFSADEFRTYLHDRFSGESDYNNIKGILGNANTDWQDEIFRTSVSTEHNLSVYGSLKNMPYRVSAGYTSQNGILRTSGMDRFTGSVSLNPELFSSHLKMNFNGKFMHIKSRFANEGAIGTAVSFDPTQAVYDPTSPYGGFFTWTDGEGNPVRTAPYNPVSLLEMTNDSSTAWNFIGNAQFDYKVHFLPDLRINLNLGIDYSKSDGGSYTPANAPSVFFDGGYDGRWDQTRKNMLLELYGQYSRDLGFLDSRFDIMGGYSWQHYNKESYHRNARITKLDEEGNPEVISSGTSINNNYLISFFGRLNYSVMNKYLLTFTLRNDGSSRFHEDNRWGLFPSVALAWRIADESFLVNSKVVSDLKLRLGWGITGQQDIGMGDYPYLGSYQYAVGDQANYHLGYINGVSNWVPVMKPLAYNPNLKWEETTTYNIGIDYGFLNNRINGSLDVYYRKTEDLINAATKTAAGTNFSEYVPANIGSLENSGIEFSINAIPIQTKDLTWEIGGNMAYNKNKILSLTFGDNSNSFRREGIKIQKVGYSTNMYYVYQQVYDESGYPIEGLYVDQNGDGVRNDEDFITYHKSTPDVVLGLNSKLTWKAWDLSFAGHGSIGNYNYYSMAANNASVDKGSIYQNTFILNRMKDVLYTNYPTTQASSSYYIQNASFFRIDNITLGWSFKKKPAFPIDGRVYATVQNPVVFTGYDGFDPEISSGIDSNFYPRPFSVLFGVNLKF